MPERKATGTGNTVSVTESGPAASPYPPVQAVTSSLQTELSNPNQQTEFVEVLELETAVKDFTERQIKWRYDCPVYVKNNLNEEHNGPFTLYQCTTNGQYSNRVDPNDINYDAFKRLLVKQCEYDDRRKWELDS
ncbi:hypothetical protein CFD26_106515 [Aspergillus turcosus]|uniref:Uncharacterized protein n=1 Tax=Aspergillus turcosus TaxID=1245748 RepID=A0A3R7F9J7_9EURO|nr:hypothetical protein CFD26_106515 [Aspergillus turcosus]